MKNDNAEMMKQITQDAEDEIREIEKKNQTSLNQVTDMSLRSKADLQITKNKLLDVQQDIKQLNRLIMDRSTQLDKQNDNIKELNSECLDKKAEIDRKDEIIHQREKNILNLKKKTQELEKFKFVLDEKIRDLRKDIAPKELEIKSLRKRTRSMDKKLKKYNSVNASLGFMVEDLRVRQGLIQNFIEKNRVIQWNNDTIINNFKNAVYQVVQYTDDHQQLKQAVNQSLFYFIKNEQKKDGEINQNIKNEYENQKKFLENSMHSLKKRLETESQIHKADNLHVMTDNMDLIQRIHDVRKNVAKIKKKRTDAENEYKQLCTKYKIKPVRNSEEQDDDDPLDDRLNMRGMMMRNPIRSEDDETLYNLNKERESRQNIIENYK